MKLLIAIVRDDYAGAVTAALNEQNLRVTRVSSTGGFWRRGNATLLIGVDESELETALEIINRNAGPEITPEQTAKGHPPHRATVFQLAVNEFARY